MLMSNKRKKYSTWTMSPKIFLASKGPPESPEHESFPRPPAQTCHLSCTSLPPNLNTDFSFSLHISLASTLTSTFCKTGLLTPFVWKYSNNKKNTNRALNLGVGVPCNLRCCHILFFPIQPPWQFAPDSVALRQGQPGVGKLGQCAHQIERQTQVLQLQCHSNGSP